MDGIVSTWTHSIVPAKDVLEQCVEFLQGQATFWLKADNREYLVDFMIALADKGTCSQTELVKLIDPVRSSFTTPSAKAWLERTFKK